MARRDRHDRGLRAPLLPVTVPGRISRAAAFDDAVRDAAHRMDARWGDRWGAVEFGTEDVPASEPAPWETGVPLGRLFPADLGQPARIVVYRRPIEQRADSHEIAALVRDVIAEHVAHLLGVTPEQADPGYGADG